jgi:CubicO group peptidase (beta-lactamase class C family)
MRFLLIILSLAVVCSSCSAQPLVINNGNSDTNNIPQLPTITPDGTTAFFQPVITPTAIALQPLTDAAPAPVLDPIEVGSIGDDSVFGTHMRNLVDAGLFSGSVLVARRGQILLRHGYGMANNTILNTATTRFRIASLSKQFTATLVLRLHEQGRLNIDDGICNYIEACPPAWAQITIRHLLSHSSGIPDYTEFRNFDATQAIPTTREELIARFRDNPLLFTPGNAFRYSNSGYVLLGSILEYVTGTPYADLIRNEITAPLGLNDTGYDHSRNGNDPSLAQGWLRQGVVADAIDTSTLDAAGALYSTVDDLFRWDRALTEGRMLRAETLAMMRTPQVKRYGLGVMLYPLGNMSVVHHDGMASGMRTFLGNFTANDITVIVLSNYETADVDGIATYLAQLASQ